MENGSAHKNGIRPRLVPAIDDRKGRCRVVRLIGRSRFIPAAAKTVEWAMHKYSVIRKAVRLPVLIFGRPFRYQNAQTVFRSGHGPVRNSKNVYWYLDWHFNLFLSRMGREVIAARRTGYLPGAGWYRFGQFTYKSGTPQHAQSSLPALPEITQSGRWGAARFANASYQLFRPKPPQAGVLSKSGRNTGAPERSRSESALLYGAQRASLENAPSKTVLKHSFRACDDPQTKNRETPAPRIGPVQDLPVSGSAQTGGPRHEKIRIFRASSPALGLVQRNLQTRLRSLPEALTFGSSAPSYGAQGVPGSEVQKAVSPMKRKPRHGRSPSLESGPSTSLLGDGQPQYDGTRMKNSATPAPRVGPVQDLPLPGWTQTGGPRHEKIRIFRASSPALGLVQRNLQTRAQTRLGSLQEAPASGSISYGAQDEPRTQAQSPSLESASSTVTFGYGTPAYDERGMRNHATAVPRVGRMPHLPVQGSAQTGKSQPEKIKAFRAGSPALRLVQRNLETLAQTRMKALPRALPSGQIAPSRPRVGAGRSDSKTFTGLPDAASWPFHTNRANAGRAVGRLPDTPMTARMSNERMDAVSPTRGIPASMLRYAESEARGLQLPVLNHGKKKPSVIQAGPGMAGEGLAGLYAREMTSDANPFIVPRFLPGEASPTRASTSDRMSRSDYFREGLVLRKNHVKENEDGSPKSIEAVDRKTLKIKAEHHQTTARQGRETSPREIREIADKVYHVLEKRIRIEKERKGSL
jgi:hypothetical protein